MKQAFTSLLFLVLINACSNEQHENCLQYNCSLYIDDSLAIRFVSQWQNDSFIVINGEERIGIPLVYKKDSVVLEHPVFNSFLVFKQKGDSLNGFWYNREKGNYKMGFKAQCATENHRESNVSYPYMGKWKVLFSPSSPDESPAVGVFSQNIPLADLKGTFLTETGDYRYLSGFVTDSSLLLQTFDFAHAYLFLASLTNDTLKGTYYSGNHWQEPWIAWKDEDFELRDAFDIAQSTGEKTSFSLKSISGGPPLHLSDAYFRNFPVIIQIFGSWCPNCYDESRFLNTIYKDYSDSIRIIGVGFERSENTASAIAKLSKFKTGLAIEYPLFYGGDSKKETASRVFSFIDTVYSFPTLILLNRKHEVFLVHTGFSGPGTGEAFIKTKQEILEAVELLIQQ